MPRTMLNDQHYWSKLKSILSNFGIYLKQNLRLFIEAILYRIRTGGAWRNLLMLSASQTLFSRNSADGVKIISH